MNDRRAFNKYKTKQMILIYNAVLNGWSVRKISDDNSELKISFKKNNAEEIVSEEDFINENSKLDFFQTP